MDGRCQRPVRALSELCNGQRDRELSVDSGSGYILEKETEDIKAVLDTAGPDAYVLGHSSGAIYALEAARHYSVTASFFMNPVASTTLSEIYN